MEQYEGIYGFMCAGHLYIARAAPRAMHPQVSGDAGYWSEFCVFFCIGSTMGLALSMPGGAFRYALEMPLDIP